MTARRGTELHAFAHNAIRLGVRLPDNGQTLSMYVNDGIGWGMSTEVTLFYTRHCWGTADSLSFKEALRLLRISDLKNGVNEASMTQLEIYAVLFCMEYKYEPRELEIELRIYQNDEVKLHVPEVDRLLHIRDRIRTFDRQIRQMELERG